MCIDPHQTGFIGKGSDHLQLIKFWPSRAPGKGVCDGAKISGLALLQPASPERFFHFPFSSLTLLVGRQEEHPACKNTGCWFVDGDDLTGALHDL